MIRRPSCGLVGEFGGEFGGEFRLYFCDVVHLRINAIRDEVGIAVSEVGLQDESIVRQVALRAYCDVGEDIVDKK